MSVLPTHSLCLSMCLSVCQSLSVCLFLSVLVLAHVVTYIYWKQSCYIYNVGSLTVYLDHDRASSTSVFVLLTAGQSASVSVSASLCLCLCLSLSLSFYCFEIAEPDDWVLDTKNYLSVSLSLSQFQSPTPLPLTHTVQTVHRCYQSFICLSVCLCLSPPPLPLSLTLYKLSTGVINPLSVCLSVSVSVPDLSLFH